MGINMAISQLESVTSEYLANIHPGTTLRLDYLPEMGISEYRFAKMLNITQSQLAELLAAKRNVTPNIALRLGKLFGQTPEMWMNMQNRYDLLKAESTYRDAIEAVQPFVWPAGSHKS